MTQKIIQDPVNMMDLTDTKEHLFDTSCKCFQAFFGLLLYMSSMVPAVGSITSMTFGNKQYALCD